MQCILCPTSSVVFIALSMQSFQMAELPFDIECCFLCFCSFIFSSFLGVRLCWFCWCWQGNPCQFLLSLYPGFPCMCCRSVVCFLGSWAIIWSVDDTRQITTLILTWNICHEIIHIKFGFVTLHLLLQELLPFAKIQFSGFFSAAFWDIHWNLVFLNIFWHYTNQVSVLQSLTYFSRSYYPFLKFEAEANMDGVINPQNYSFNRSLPQNLATRALGDSLVHQSWHSPSS